MRLHRLVIFALIGSLFIVAALPVAAQDMIGLLGESQLCPDSDFTCVSIPMPLDHFDPDNGETIDITFAVIPASGERKGMFVTVVGGPGYSGVAASDWYSSYFDPLLFESFDIVFFDQRGIGNSSGVYCPVATVAYYSSAADASTPEGEAETVEAARTYAQDCRAEMGEESDSILPYLSTRQAIEDLELFRQMVGDEQIWLYGESYGTQFSQTYATKYPERIAGLILDGVVDLSLEGDVYYIQQAEAFAGALTATLQACNENAACAADMGGDAFAAYDRVIEQLPMTVDFPLSDGTTEPRELTAADIETVVSTAVYDRESRSGFLRQLAAAQRGELIPMLRALYSALVVDPITLEPVEDLTWSDASYYSIECSDYDFFGAAGDTDARAEAWLRAGDALEAELPYLSSIFYGDMPCLFWGVQGEPTRPEPFTGGDYPTFILNSNIDPATPFRQGNAMFDQIQNAYMITQLGAPHVIFGRELSCPDVALTNFLIDDELPAAHEYICDGDAIDDYDPLPPANAADFESVVEAVRAFDLEIQNLPEYVGWGGYAETTIGCDYGGTLTFISTDEEETFTIDKCSLFEGITFDGEAIYTYDEAFEYELRVSGVFEGELSYTYDIETEMYTAAGMINGEPLELTP